MLWFNSFRDSNKCGVSILISRKGKGVIQNIKLHHDTDGRNLICECTINETSYVFCNVYGPNTDDPAFWINIAKKLDGLAADNIIIGGDFNHITDPNMDSKGRLPTHPKSIDCIKQIMQDIDMVDIWRIINPDSRIYTWKKLKPPPTFSHLDKFLINPDLMTSIENCTINTVLFTDHSSVKLVIRQDDFIRGPGVWKLSNTHLNNNKFQNEIRNVISHMVSDGASSLDPDALWDSVKESIVEYCKRFSKENQKTNRHE